ncbi:MAG TPA: glycosyltransferase [Bacteroidia bacterium]|nr:glycosyltransferase [Bacteroidia bacterium]
MNIWLLTSEFPPDFGGGISTYCLETVQMFSLSGHNVTVITQDYQVDQLTKEKKDGCMLVRFNPSKYFTSSFLGYEANLAYAFSQVVKELIDIDEPPDVIESQEYMGIAYYLLQYKCLQYPIFKDLKIVVTLHAPSFLYWEYNKVPLYQLPYFWVGEMERFCIRSADMVISPSKYLVKELESRVKTDDITIHILKNPLKISEHYSELKYTKNKILFFGKLIPQKGCLELLTYFKKLWAEGFENSLTMIGGGDHLYHPEGIDMIDFIKKTYQKEIEKGLLVLLGSIPPKKLKQYISDAHIIIIPSIVDNLPYTVPEVMSLGKIVLASVQGGQSEIIENGIDGFLFDHTDPYSFKNKLEYILSLPEESLRNISLNAYNKVQTEFAYPNIYNKKHKLFENLIAKKNTKKEFPLIRPQPCKKHFINDTNDTIGLLSVIVPYFNMGKYVEETILSIINSSYKKTEIILVNDGSTGEENLSILNKLVDKYKIKVINKSNEGLALARNTGAKIAMGQYLAFLDPDDTVEPEYYEKAISVLKAYENIYFAGCWAKYFGEANGYWPTFNPEPPYLLVHNMINSSALVYKKQAFLSFGLNDAQMIYGMEDYESVISLIENGYQGVALPEPLWNYRVRKDSMARGFTNTKQVYLYRLIAEKHANFYSKFGADITNILNANGPGFKYDNPTFFHNVPGISITSNKFKQKIITIAKSNPLLRKIAIKIKKRLK